MESGVVNEKNLGESKVAMVYGQMNEPPCNRLRVALTGLTLAEYFRDEGRDVLFFVDNIYRYTLAGTEVSALLGRMPSDAIGRAHVGTPVTHAQIVCRLLLRRKKT